jgi:hypothetical protein
MNHPGLAGQLTQYDMTLLEMKGFTETEPLLRECQAVRKKGEPNAWTTVNSMSMLGGSLPG